MNYYQPTFGSRINNSRRPAMNADQRVCLVRPTSPANDRNKSA
jgi:hypothetical protein